MNQHAMALKNATVPLVLTSALVLLLAGLAAPVAQKHQPHDQPPTVVLTETAGFVFPTGSAKLADDFTRRLTETVIPRIVEIALRYDCDVIEVIGHTDGRPVRSASNLDEALVAAIRRGLTEVVPGSNADLGLMRAWAVARIFRFDERLRHFHVAAYSAGHVLHPDGRYAGEGDNSDEPTRRRIEVRVRRAPRAKTAAVQH